MLALTPPLYQQKTSQYEEDSNSMNSSTHYTTILLKVLHNPEIYQQKTRNAKKMQTLCIRLRIRSRPIIQRYCWKFYTIRKYRIYFLERLEVLDSYCNIGDDAIVRMKRVDPLPLPKIAPGNSTHVPCTPGLSLPSCSNSLRGY